MIIDRYKFTSLLFLTRSLKENEKKTAEIICSHIFKYIMRELLQFQYIFHNDNGHHNHSSSCARQSDKRDR